MSCPSTTPCWRAVNTSLMGMTTVLKPKPCMSLMMTSPCQTRIFTPLQSSMELMGFLLLEMTRNPLGKAPRIFTPRGSRCLYTFWPMGPLNTSSACS